MVSANEALRAAAQILKNANIDEALLEARLLFKFITKQDFRLIQSAQAITDCQAQSLYNACRKRASHYPIQYIIGKWPFMNLELFIGEGVLIPRSDTEVVCEAASEKCKGLQAPAVLDLCAGSGAIGLGIKSLVPQASVTAVELSPVAFEYLTQNAMGNIQCVKADVFAYEAELKCNSFDIIASNPPYITADEMTELAPELMFEPRSALTDEGDGLSFYRHIAGGYFSKLKSCGWLVFEIGAAQAQAVTDICKAEGYEQVQLRLDLSMNPRAVLAKKP